MANTTNLDLVKPAGTDKALVSVINANSDKIDAFAGTTNQAIQTLRLSDCDLTDDTLFSGDAHTVAPGIYRCAANTTNIPVAETGYLTVITRADNTKYLQYMTSSGKFYYQMLNNGTWGAWQDVALKSDISRTLLGSFSNPSANITVTLSDSVNNYNYIQIFFQKSDTTGAFVSQIIHTDNVSIGSFDSISFSAYNTSSYNFYAEGGFSTATKFNIATYRSTGWTMSRVYVIGIGKK